MHIPALVIACLYCRQLRILRRVWDQNDLPFASSSCNVHSTWLPMMILLQFTQSFQFNNFLTRDSLMNNTSLSSSCLLSSFSVSVFSSLFLSFMSLNFVGSYRTALDESFSFIWLKSWICWNWTLIGDSWFLWR